MTEDFDPVPEIKKFKKKTEPQLFVFDNIPNSSSVSDSLGFPSAFALGALFNPFFGSKLSFIFLMGKFIFSSAKYNVSGVVQPSFHERSFQSQNATRRWVLDLNSVYSMYFSRSYATICERMEKSVGECEYDVLFFTSP